MLRQTLVIKFGRGRLELSGSPTAGEALELTTQERRLEHDTRRLSEDGVIVHKDGEAQLGRQGHTLSEKHRQEDARRYRLIEEMQQTSSRWRAASSASAGTGAAPSAGEAAAPGAGEAASAGAGEAASAGSQSSYRPRSSFSSIAARAIGQGPRSRRHRSQNTPQTVRARAQQ